MMLKLDDSKKQGEVVHVCTYRQGQTDRHAFCCQTGNEYGESDLDKPGKGVVCALDLVPIGGYLKDIL